MLILKRTNGIGEVFDTENIESRTKSEEMPDVKKSLFLHTHTSDFNFLLRFFPRRHPIFILFEESFYFVV